MAEFLKMLATLCIVVAIICFSAWWLVIQWNECRDAGLSILYCIQHIS